MTTDTAVRVTREVVWTKQGKQTACRPSAAMTLRVSLDQLSYVDHPELKINRHESTQMPFRYIKGANGEPVMPEVRRSKIDFVLNETQRKL